MDTDKAEDRQHALDLEAKCKLQSALTTRLSRFVVVVAGVGVGASVVVSIVAAEIRKQFRSRRQNDEEQIKVVYNFQFCCGGCCKSIASQPRQWPPHGGRERERGTLWQARPDLSTVSARGDQEREWERSKRRKRERESVYIQCRARRCGFYDLARHLLANSHCVRLKDTEIDTDTNTNTDTDTDTWTGSFENREAKRKKFVAVNGQQHVWYSVRRRLKVFYALRGWSQAKGQTVGHRQRTLKRAGRLFNNLALWNTQQEKSNNKIHMYT